LDGKAIAAIFEQITGMARKHILNTATVRMKLQRMAFEIIESNLTEPELILVGVKENGSVIARNMQRILQQVSSIKVTLTDLQLDKKHPTTVELSDKTDFNNKVIIIVDDVANSGKTMLYALKPFLEYHPKKIQTLALVARTHKAFPVHLDYTGLSVATTLQEHIFVEVSGEEIIGAYME